MKIRYFMSHGSPWTFLGHKRVNEISKKNNCELDIMPVNYGEIFPVSGGLPVHKRPKQRQPELKFSFLTYDFLLIQRLAVSLLIPSVSAILLALFPFSCK